MAENPYAVDYRPGWLCRIDDTGPIRPRSYQIAAAPIGRDYDTLTQGGKLKVYGPFDKGREHNYNGAIE